MAQQVIRTGAGEVEFVDSLPVPATSTARQVGLGTARYPGAWRTPDAVTTSGESVTLRLLVGPGHLDPIAGSYFLWWRYELTDGTGVEDRTKQTVRIITDGGVPIDPAQHDASTEYVDQRDTATLAAANAYTDQHAGTGGIPVLIDCGGPNNTTGA